MSASSAELTSVSTSAVITEDLLVKGNAFVGVPNSTPFEAGNLRVNNQILTEGGLTSYGPVNSTADITAVPREGGGAYFVGDGSKLTNLPAPTVPAPAELVTTFEGAISVVPGLNPYGEVPDAPTPPAFGGSCFIDFTTEPLLSKPGIYFLVQSMENLVEDDFLVNSNSITVQWDGVRLLGHSNQTIIQIPGKFWPFLLPGEPPLSNGFWTQVSWNVAFDVLVYLQNQIYCTYTTTILGSVTPETSKVRVRCYRIATLPSAVTPTAERAAREIIVDSTAPLEVTLRERARALADISAGRAIIVHEPSKRGRHIAQGPPRSAPFLT